VQNNVKPKVNPVVNESSDPFSSEEGEGDPFSGNGEDPLNKAK